MNFCRACRWLHGSAKGAPPSQWLCAHEHAIRTTPDRVSGETPPFYQCWRIRNVQAGDDCPLFEIGPNCLNPNPMPQPLTEGQEVS